MEVRFVDASYGVSHGTVIAGAMWVAAPSGRGLQRHPNLLECLKHVRSGRVRRALQTRGNAVVGQPVELALDQSGFLFHRKSVDDGKHMPFHVLRQQEVFRVIMPEPIRSVQGLLDGCQHLMQSHIRMSPQTSEVVLTEIRGDFEQPGAHIGVFR